MLEEVFGGGCGGLGRLVEPDSMIARKRILVLVKAHAMKQGVN